MTLLRRLILLLALLAAGVAIGVLGHRMSGSALWYLAVPVALAAGWLRVADPTQCQPQTGQNPGMKGPRES